MKKRTSGVLLHITSIPSRFGIGDLGPQAYRFAELLSEAGQTYWQILPLNPTDQMSGNSPYSSISAYAGNTILISPDVLVEWGLLIEADLGGMPLFPPEHCDYTQVIPYKESLLDRAFTRFETTGIQRDNFLEFCHNQDYWLEDFALFKVLKKYHEGRMWSEWEAPYRDREEVYCAKFKADFSTDIEREKFFQYLFFRQWSYLRQFCNEKGVKIIGDMPIYVSYDSVDVWTNPRIFKLNKKKKPISVSGVPPDYFSKTGQLWGNPTYRWDVLKSEDFAWWLQRFEHYLRLFDTMRIDHFRGFVGFWEVPASEKTAINGYWVEAPAPEFFTSLTKHFPHVQFIAEDLGVITPDVREIMERFGFTGMRILQFGFNDDNVDHPYLPHNYISNCVAYTGTHDNNTLRGWFENEADDREKQRVFQYMGKEIGPDLIARELIRLMLFSSADTVIFPMQDILGLSEESRMNRPSVAYGNWAWRLLPDRLVPDSFQSLKEMTQTYGRTSSNRG
jgi:4-alpha-glucanotransferase